MSEWALFDQLTGLLNRRAFLHRADQEYRSAKHSPCSVAGICREVTESGG